MGWGEKTQREMVREAERERDKLLNAIAAHREKQARFGRVEDRKLYEAAGLVKPRA